jgi:hypothetical protein
MTLDLTITTLIHIASGITEAKWNENRVWVKARYYEKRYYIPTPRASKDRSDGITGTKEYCQRFLSIPDWKGLIFRRSRKRLTTRFGGADAEHLSKRCIRWKEQRVVIWREIRMATNRKWSAAAVGGMGRAQRQF